jgi:hypothetical protein
MSLDELSTEQQVGLVGAAAIIFGAFLPWFEVSVLGTTATEAGFSHDGLYTAPLGFGVIFALAFAEWREKIQGLVFGVGVLVSTLAAVYIVDPFIFGYEGPEAQRQLAESTVTAGSGLYVTLLGGLALVIVSVIALNDSITEDFAERAAPDTTDRTDVDE